MLLSDYQLQVQQLVHDTAGIDYSQSDLTGFINQARSVTAQNFWCVRTFFQSCSAVIGQGGATDQFGNIIGEVYPMSGGIGGAIITNAGSGYSSPPTVTFGAPPAGGIQATGVAIMGGTAPNQFVQQIGMTSWGGGYTSVPTLTFGSGAATATAVALLNVIDVYTVTYKFGLQAPMLQWSPFAPFQAFLRAYRGQTGAPAVWSNFTEMNRWYLWPMLPDQNYPLEIDAYVIPNPLVNLTDVDTQVPAPLNDCVQYYAAHLAISKTQNFNQASFYLNRYNTRAKELGASRFAPRRPNIYQGNWRRLQRGYW